MFVHASVFGPFPWQSFTAPLFLCLFSLLAQTPLCITAFRLLRSLFLGFLIDTQQPSSLNCVFYAPWFSALSSCLMFPFLGRLNDISLHCLLPSPPVFEALATTNSFNKWCVKLPFCYIFTSHFSSFPPGNNRFKGVMNKLPLLYTMGANPALLWMLTLSWVIVVSRIVTDTEPAACQTSRFQCKHGCLLLTSVHWKLWDEAQPKPNILAFVNGGRINLATRTDKLLIVH